MNGRSLILMRNLKEILIKKERVRVENQTKAEKREYQTLKIKINIQSHNLTLN